ncbi:MAG: pyridoxal-dependent decarboxylase [Actinomycetota bacterium]
MHRDPTIEPSDDTAILRGVIDRAATHLLDPPRGADPVIAFASPDDLATTFAETVGLAIEADAAANPDDQLLAAVDQIIEWSMHTGHPRFVNQNFAGADPISVVGDWLGAALNTTGATYEVAPVFTLMESAVLHKLGRLAGYVDRPEADLPALPPGVFCAGGSMGTLLALQLARHRHQPDITTVGSNGDRLALFVSASGHYAATKSASLLGIGSDGVVEVDTDGHGRMVPDALGDAIVGARRAGHVPFAVIGTAGTTVTAAFDELGALADICRREDLWLHVDACYGGSALFSPAQAWRLDGVEHSDSMVWNLHKMMGMTQQCTALLVKDPTRLAACFAARADYLFQSDKLNGEYDSGDRTFMCARRIDGLKLWLTWKARGDRAFAARIDHAVAMAEHTRRRIDASDGAFVPLVLGDFTNVVFAWVPPRLRASVPTTATGELDLAALDRSVRSELHGYPPQIKARLQTAGTGMIGFQPVGELNAFRMICISPTLQPDDVDALLGAIDSCGLDATGAPAPTGR